MPGLNTRRACHSIKGKAARAMLALSGRPFVASLGMSIWPCVIASDVSRSIPCMPLMKGMSSAIFSVGTGDARGCHPRDGGPCSWRGDGWDAYNKCFKVTNK